MTVLTLAALAVLATLPWTLSRPGARASDPRGQRASSAGSSRRPPAPRGVDPAVLLDLADAALAAGSSVPGTLLALGRALPPEATRTGDLVGAAGELTRAGRALLIGASWAQAWEGASPGLAALRDALEPAWEDGADPGPLLRQAAVAVRAARARQAQEAAARLGVRLVLPLGLCYLPAFVLLGVLPVVLGAGWLVVG